MIISLKPYYAKFFIIIVCILLEVTFYTFNSFSLKLIIEALNDKDELLLTKIIGGLFGFFILIIPVIIFRHKLYANMVGSVTLAIRTKLYEKLEQLSIDYYSNNSTEDTLRYCSDTFNSLEKGLSGLSESVIKPCLFFCVNTIFLSILNWKLTLVSMVIVPFMFIAPKKIISLIANYNMIGASITPLKPALRELIVLQPIIRIFHLTLFLKNKVIKIATDVTANNAKINFLNYLIKSWTEIAPIFFILSVVSVSSYMVYNNLITLSSLVAFQMIFSTMIYSTTRWINNLSSLTDGVTAWFVIKEFLKKENTFGVKKNLVEIKDFTENITIDSLTFSYDNDVKVLDQINLTIPRNHSVAFVGRSGSGKTTLLNLIVGLHQPTTGKILIDSQDMSSISPCSLYNLISVVFQEAMLFNASIYENIKFGNLNATQQMIESAAKMAKIHDFIISLPLKYDTILKEGSSNLSRGQCQRISVARALLSKPKILLLDEITSALDLLTMSEMNSTIEDLRKNQTTVTVTHHLDSIVDYNCIYVIDKGTIVQYGTHEHLIKQEGFYKKTWDKQHGFIIDKNYNDATITAERLRAIPLFSALSLKIIENCIKLFIVKNYSIDEVVFEEGDIGELFFIIAYGKLEVLKNYNTEQQKRIQILETGDYFGEIALIRSVPRTATIKTITPCLLLVLNAKNFHNLLSQNESLRQKIQQELERRLSMQD